MNDKCNITTERRLRVYVRANSFLLKKPDDWHSLSPDEKEEYVYEAAEELGKLETSYEEVPCV